MNLLLCLPPPQEHHQSYPNIMHGGMSSAILDEVIGRAIMTKYKDQVWGVTVELNLRYKKPVPLYKELKVVGRITKERGPIFEGTGEIILPNGDVAVTASGKYLKMSIDKISPDEFSDSEWFLMEDESEIQTIDV